MIDKQKESKMTKNPLVSIIVPVYKVEDYLDRCIESIILQTYKNIEVFLVDDGSPDNCGQMCDEYAKKYLCIKVIHQENQGQASARNNAVLFARGEFIVFIDSDDFVERDCIEYLVGMQRKYDADVTIGGSTYLYEGGKIHKRLEESSEIEMTPEETLIYMNYSKGFGATPWAKLYKKNLIVSHPFPAGQIYEDLATLYKIIGDCNKIVFGNKRIYYWIQHEDNTTRMAFDERQLFGINAALEQLKYIEERFPHAIPAAKARYMGKIVEIMGGVYSLETHILFIKN